MPKFQLGGGKGGANCQSSQSNRISVPKPVLAKQSPARTSQQSVRASQEKVRASQESVRTSKELVRTSQTSAAKPPTSNIPSTSVKASAVRESYQDFAANVLNLESDNDELEQVLVKAARVSLMFSYV